MVVRGETLRKQWHKSCSSKIYKQLQVEWLECWWFRVSNYYRLLRSPIWMRCNERKMSSHIRKFSRKFVVKRECRLFHRALLAMREYEPCAIGVTKKKVTHTANGKKDEFELAKPKTRQSKNQSRKNTKSERARTVPYLPCYLDSIRTTSSKLHTVLQSRRQWWYPCVAYAVVNRNGCTYTHTRPVEQCIVCGLDACRQPFVCLCVRVCVRVSIQRSSVVRMCIFTHACMQNVALTNSTQRECQCNSEYIVRFFDVTGRFSLEWTRRRSHCSHIMNYFIHFRKHFNA